MNTSKENYTETLARLRKQLGSSRFLRWWLGELFSLVPTSMRSSTARLEDFMLLPLMEVNAQLVPVDGGDQRNMALTLPDDRILRKKLKLPIATEENLRQVLEFQMEQHTPFSPTQVYFGYGINSRDFEHGQMEVEFVVTPRDGVDAAIKALSVLGYSVRVVFAEALLADGKLINLLPSMTARAPSKLWNGVNPWLAALLALLVVAAIAVPIIVKRGAVVQMLPWVDKGKKAAEIVDTMRHELEARVEQHNFVLERRQKTPTVIQTLEELTRVLPDDTWVQTLDLKGRELQIHGETASSVRLIGLFEQSSIFRDASFRSPLTKGQAVGTERYQLALQVRPVESANAASTSMPPASTPMPATSTPMPAASTPMPAPARPPGPPSVEVVQKTSSSAPAVPFAERKQGFN